MSVGRDICPLCQTAAILAGKKRGRRSGREFSLARCTGCGFAWVVDPWTDYAAIYDEAYYRGEGSDPSVDYAFEYEQPQLTVRRAEWSGVLRAVTTLEPTAKRWLDFGCGNGGLLRYVASHSDIAVEGYDTGAWATRARSDGLNILDDTGLAREEGRYDVVTAIEVIEHLADPVRALSQLRKMLRPGGLLFLTTGNAACAPTEFCKWSYVAPEIHLSYFTPQALRRALEAGGFRAEFRGAVPGFRDIIRFKVLKGLNWRKHRFWHDLLPWSLLASVADRHHGISALPIGRAV